MNKIHLKKWSVAIDLAQTKAFYRNNSDWCSCLDCENDREAVKCIDSSVAEVFKVLGIDSSKPGHLSEFGAVEDGNRLYSGC